MTPLGNWLTTAEACQISGYHPDHLRVLIRQEKIIAQKWGNAWMVDQSSLLDYLKRMDALGERRGPKPSKKSQ